MLGAAGLAVGLALQSSLSNFAARVLMLIFRPFAAGDYVECAGTAGVMEKVQIFSTRLRTPDNKLVIVPNGAVYSGNVVNYSANDSRRLDLAFGVSYADDIDHVKRVIGAVLDAEPRLLADPVPTIGLLELGDSSVVFAARPRVRTSDYWLVYFEPMEAMKKRFDAEGITIPFPQRDVHLSRQETGMPATVASAWE